MKKIIYSCTAALLCFSVSAQKPAIVASDKTGWHKIGETTVDFNREEDQVAVLAADRFAMLKFRVTGAPIELVDLDVYFEEGDKQNIRIGSAIKPEGSESKPIDMKGGAERELKRIVFRYKTVDKDMSKKARVEIWGKKTNPDKKAQKEKDGKMNEKASEAKKDVKDASKEAKKETKAAAREAKKEAKETKKELEDK